MADAWGGAWGSSWNDAWGTAAAGEDALSGNDVTSASSVSQPALAEIAPGVDALLAEDVVSASFVSTPTLQVEGEVIPIPPEVGGGGKVYGRGYSRRRYEELLRRSRRAPGGPGTGERLQGHRRVRNGQ